MTAAEAILTVYYGVLLLLSLYGSHRYRLAWAVARRGAAARAAAARAGTIGAARLEESPPEVTIQLPVFNERYVVERLVRAVCAMEYPKDRLVIQVLDDSTDDTAEIAARVVAEHERKGFRIRHVRREDRAGFKAGALQRGLDESRSPFVAIFDADFVPGPGFLREALPQLLADPGVGMVQARWDHINRSYSLLTDVQAILLDGHFIGEHGGRHASGCYFNFNGTAGIWRREAIGDAGGWQGDTLTEDLDLSYRAQLRGWRFVFLPEVEAPAELPVSMNAFKTQQRRWAMGSVQTARKLLPQVLASRVPLRVRLEALFHLTGNLAYPLMALLSLLMIPALVARVGTGLREMVLLDIPFFVAATASVVSFYALAQHRVLRLSDGPGEPGLFRRMRGIPMALAVGIGLSFSNAAAVFDGFRGRRTPFVRTPKYGVETSGDAWRGKMYRALAGRVAWVETLVGAALAAGVFYAVGAGVAASAPFLALFAAGYLYVGVRSLWESRSPPAPAGIGRIEEAAS